jgi:hypothetical protein
MLAERILYMPSVGYCLLLALLYQYALSTRPKYRAVTRVLFVALIVWYGHLTVERNNDWRDEETLFVRQVI